MPCWAGYTHSLAGGDLQDLGGKADGALDTELLVLSTVNQIGRDYDKSVNTKLVSRARTKGIIHFSKFLTLLLVSVIRIL